MNHRPSLEEAHPNPGITPMFLAMVRAFREAARRGVVPDFAPDVVRRSLLVSKTRHRFNA